jgi:hypothetical protein
VGVDITGIFTASGNSAFDTNTLFVDVNSHRVAIGKTRPNSTLDVVGTINATSQITSGTGFKSGANVVWHEGNDGSGSGLDADLLDGNNSDFFTNATNMTTGTLRNNGLVGGTYSGISAIVSLGSLSASNGSFDNGEAYTSANTLTVLGNVKVGTTGFSDETIFFVDGKGSKVAIGKSRPTQTLDIVGTVNATGRIASDTGFLVGANTVWHEGNDGSGSGLDADLLDGNNSNFFTNATNMTTGTLPTGRISGAYTGITDVGTLATLNVSGVASFAGTANITGTVNIAGGAANTRLILYTGHGAATGMQDIYNEMPGFEFISRAINENLKYWPGIKWMTTDPQVNTATPRLTAYVTVRGTENFSDDNRIGTAIDFGVARINHGNTSPPPNVMTLISNTDNSGVLSLAGTNSVLVVNRLRMTASNGAVYNVTVANDGTLTTSRFS